MSDLKPVQNKYFHSDKRFNVAACGRRSGKTHIAKLRLRKRLCNPKLEGLHFVAAPTYGQVKRLYWQDMLDMFAPVITDINKSDLIITIAGMSELHLLGLDKPERIEGTPWVSGLIDEFADTKRQAWLENIRPALSTPGLNTTCDIIGVPDGLNHFYDVSEYAKSDPEEWAFHTWHSSIILNPKEIEAARRELDKQTFQQEYEASFQTATGIIYKDYKDQNHTERELLPGDIHWTHDFNYFPMSSAICQIENDNVFVVGEIVIDHADSSTVAREFIDRHNPSTVGIVYIYGDPTGKAGEKHGMLSNYITLETMLRDAGFRVERKLMTSCRSIRDSQNSLKGRICNAKEERRFFVNPKKAPTADRGLKTAQFKKGSTHQEDDTNRNQHITTALRYMAEFRYPILGNATMTVR